MVRGSCNFLYLLKILCNHSVFYCNLARHQPLRPGPLPRRGRAHHRNPAPVWGIAVTHDQRTSRWQYTVNRFGAEPEQRPNWLLLVSVRPYRDVHREALEPYPT